MLVVDGVFSLEDGTFAVKLAREAVKIYIETNKQIKPPKNFFEKFNEKYGVFVTLKTLSLKEDKIVKNLRSCIAFSYPVYPLIEAIIESATASATCDSRFYPPFGPDAVKSEELNKIVFEISILTPSVFIKLDNPKKYLEKIKIGRDELIIERGGLRGLLLPQVPVEWKWNVEEYLEHTCKKAFLPVDSWKKKDTKIYTFQAIIFEEIEPLGEIRIKKIGED
ncbi:MAG: TIGR00296 family protein [Promethearchaeota archaeon]